LFVLRVGFDRREEGLDGNAATDNELAASATDHAADGAAQEFSHTRAAMVPGSSRTRPELLKAWLS
jgi:hypothetical protein